MDYEQQRREADRHETQRRLEADRAEQRRQQEAREAHQRREDDSRRHREETERQRQRMVEQERQRHYQEEQRERHFEQAWRDNDTKRLAEERRLRDEHQRNDDLRRENERRDERCRAEVVHKAAGDIRQSIEIQRTHDQNLKARTLSQPRPILSAKPAPPVARPVTQPSPPSLQSVIAWMKKVLTSSQTSPARSAQQAVITMPTCKLADSVLFTKSSSQSPHRNATMLLWLRATLQALSWATSVNVPQPDQHDH